MPCPVEELLDFLLKVFFAEVLGQDDLVADVPTDFSSKAGK
jgi:hypothetical protein